MIITYARLLNDGKTLNDLWLCRHGYVVNAHCCPICNAPPKPLLTDYTQEETIEELDL